MKNNKYLFSLLISFLLVSCQEERVQEETTDKTAPVSTVAVPSFNSDSAYHYIQKQVDFGPRVPNSRPSRMAANYLIDKLESFGWNVTSQVFESTAYDGTVLQLKNIIASYNPDASKRILLAAHWDTRPFAEKDTKDKNKPIDGANDGASGVGVLLEIARTISNNEGPTVGVDIILFDGEDYGAPDNSNGNEDKGWCLGSRYWGENKHKPNYSAYYGILLDMVGAKDARFYREGYSMEIAPSIVKKVWDKAHSIGHGHFFVYKNGSPITDDHIYVYKKAKIPMIDIIDYDPEHIFRSYHHTHDDNMGIIDKNTLQAVGETVLHVLYHE